MEARAASAGNRVAGGGEKRAKFAGGEIVEGAEAGGEPCSGETTLAIQAAQEIGGGLFCFFRIALQTTGDEVAVRVAAELHFWNDMVDALHAGTQMAQAVEAEATLSGVNGFAK
jgi:hypothetical protein